MDNKDNGIVNVPYVVYESAQNRMEQINKRLLIALIITVILVFISNLAWLYAWCQYDYSSEETSNEVTVDGKDGIANYIGNDGDINNGISESEEDN